MCSGEISEGIWQLELKTECYRMATEYPNEHQEWSFKSKIEQININPYERYQEMVTECFKTS